jgi:signal recognition particle GTPase
VHCQLSIFRAKTSIPKKNNHYKDNFLQHAPSSHSGKHQGDEILPPKVHLSLRPSPKRAISTSSLAFDTKKDKHSKSESKKEKKEKKEKKDKKDKKDKKEKKDKASKSVTPRSEEHDEEKILDSLRQHLEGKDVSWWADHGEVGTVGQGNK